LHTNAKELAFEAKGQGLDLRGQGQSKEGTSRHRPRGLYSGLVLTLFSRPLAYV